MVSSTSTQDSTDVIKAKARCTKNIESVTLTFLTNRRISYWNAIGLLGVKGVTSEARTASITVTSRGALTGARAKPDLHTMCVLCIEETGLCKLTAADRIYKAAAAWPRQAAPVVCVAVPSDISAARLIRLFGASLDALALHAGPPGRAMPILGTAADLHPLVQDQAARWLGAVAVLLAVREAAPLGLADMPVGAPIGRVAWLVGALPALRAACAPWPLAVRFLLAFQSAAILAAHGRSGAVQAVPTGEERAVVVWLADARGPGAVLRAIAPGAAGSSFTDGRRWAVLVLLALPARPQVLGAPVRRASVLGLACWELGDARG